MFVIGRIDFQAKQPQVIHAPGWKPVVSILSRLDTSHFNTNSSSETSQLLQSIQV